MPKHHTWIVKIGGSLIGSPDLEQWLSAIGNVRRTHRVVVVPGGGVFADTVRTAQTALRLDDGVAHQMALQAMRLFGTALAALSSAVGAFELAQLTEIEAAGPRNGVWIWDPCDPRLRASGLPHNWRISADSLSLWLAGEFDDAHLLLVKSAAPAQRSADLSGLVAEGFVDAYFPVLHARIERPAWWLERTQYHALLALLDGTPMRHNVIGGDSCRHG